MACFPQMAVPREIIRACPGPAVPCHHWVEVCFQVDACHPAEVGFRGDACRPGEVGFRVACRWVDPCHSEESCREPCHLLHHGFRSPARLRAAPTLGRAFQSGRFFQIARTSRRMRATPPEAGSPARFAIASGWNAEKSWAHGMQYPSPLRVTIKSARNFRRMP